MRFDPDRLLNWDFGEKRQSYEARDAILYALGVGLPIIPGESDDLNFLIEDRLRVLPSFAVTLATPGMWPKAPELGIDWVRLLHTAHSVRFEHPLPPAADVVSRARIVELYDRGADKGAVCVLRREVTDAQTGITYCSIDQTIALRGNGGFGGAAMPMATRVDMPDRNPDHTESIKTSERAAYIYRLSGDYNPLHADYDVARRAGFERPILHGLASFGTACAVIMRVFAQNEPACLRGLEMRFSGVVLPGDRLDFAFWQDAGRVSFEAKVGDRPVISQGAAVLMPTIAA